MTKTFSMTDASTKLLFLLATLYNRSQSAQIRSVIYDEAHRTLEDPNVPVEAKDKIKALLAEATNV